MRPLLAGIAALCVFGSVGLYFLFIKTLPPVPADYFEMTKAEGKFTVDITLTFDAQSDSFAVEPTSMLLKFEGRDVFRTAQTVRAGVPLIVEVPDVKVGKNQFFVEVRAPEVSISATGSFATSDFYRDLGENAAAEQVVIAARAVRVRVLRDGVPIASETLWSEPGQAVAGSIEVDVPAISPGDQHDH